MEHIDVSNQSLAAQEAEIYRFVIRTTDLKDPVCTLYNKHALNSRAKASQLLQAHCIFNGHCEGNICGKCVKMCVLY